MDECPTGGDAAGLPSALRQVIAAPPPPSAWIPEAHLVAAHFAIMDMHGLDVEDMLERTYRANRKLTESRMYRALAKVASPTIILKGARMSWGFIHKGVQLRADFGERSARITLRHPPHLYPRLAHRSAALGFRAVLEACHGENPSAVLVSSSPEEARVELEW